MNKYKVRLSNGKEHIVESKDFFECYNNALKGEENNVEVVLIELIPSKLTEVERIILENTSEENKYIARDENGSLFLYPDKPKKECEKYGWLASASGCESFCLFNHLFQNIKWSDEEPYKFR